MVDGGGLENRCTRKGIGGSNPSPSANLRSGARRRLRAIAAKRLTFLTAGFILTAASAEAQPVPLTITCNDANGRAVTAVQVSNGTIAKAVIDSDARAVVQYDPRKVDGVLLQDQLFVYAHECGHHALGHDPRASFSAAQEQEADCGENAIGKASRAGRVIDGMYSVRNGCARDVNCTSTIEVGTACRY